MPRRHWLDPLARRVLQAAGQLPSLPVSHPAATIWTIEVNRASREKWLQLPGCSEDTADLLLRLQRGGVQFSSVEELFRLLELSAQQRRSWKPHLVVQWHGDDPPQPPAAPLDLNNSSAEELQTLGWPEQRLQGLLRERRRDGFRDLADLQERLCLPASAIEALIGRVCFEARRAGPSLPLN